MIKIDKTKKVISIFLRRVRRRLIGSAKAKDALISGREDELLHRYEANHELTFKDLVVDCGSINDAVNDLQEMICEEEYLLSRRKRGVVLVLICALVVIIVSLLVYLVVAMALDREVKVTESILETYDYE